MSGVEKKQFHSVDAGRLVMALFVLTYHCRPWDGMAGTALPRVLSLFTGTSVAYFFLVSGFFIFRGMEFPLCGEDRRRFFRAISRQLRLYLLWSVVYLPLSVYGELEVYGRTPVRAAVDIAWGMAVLGRNYLSWHLWYLMALMISELILFLLARAGLRERGMVWLSAAFFLAGRVLDVLHMAEDFPGKGMVDGYFTVFGSTYTALFSGLFYVSLGLYAARHRTEQGTEGRKGQWAEYKKTVLGLGAIGLGAAAYLFYHWYLTASVLLAGCILCIFLWMLEIDLKDSPVFPFLKEMSRMIYLVHLLFYGMFTILLPDGNRDPVKVFLYTLAATLVFSAAAAWRKTRKTAGG